VCTSAVISSAPN